MGQVVKSLINELKIPENLGFWWSQEKNNIEFMSRKIEETEINVEITRKTLEITSLTDSFLETVSKKIAQLKKIKTTELTLSKLETRPKTNSISKSNNNHPNKTNSGVVKFSVSNDNELYLPQSRKRTIQRKCTLATKKRIIK